MKTIIKTTFLFVSATFFIFVSAFILNSQEEEFPKRYVGADKCALCHRALHEEWSQGKHKKTLEEAPSESFQGCEACHGPGSKHVETTGDISLIINPANLPPEEADKICLNCHLDSAAAVPDNWKKITEKYWKRTKHAKNDLSCMKCHRMHGGTSDLLVSEKRELCLSCHSNIAQVTENSYLHMPVKSGLCSKCHKPHGTAIRHMVTEDIAATCQQCHDLDAEKSIKSHRGYPVKDKNCMLCHDPHSTDKNKKLIAQYTHVPFRGNQCEKCHNAASDPEPLKLRASINELCMTCHAKDHEKFLAKGTLVHYPVEKKFCVGCHAPHASRYKEMTKDQVDYTCFTCHPKVEDDASQKFRHPPVHKGWCLKCHDPKAANYAKLLIKDMGELCSSCHKTQATHTHPLGTDLVIPKTDKIVHSLTCSTCHNTHGSTFAYILRGDRNTICYECHTF